MLRVASTAAWRAANAFRAVNAVFCLRFEFWSVEMVTRSKHARCVERYQHLCSPREATILSRFLGA